MARHLVAYPDPALVWADNNLESPDALAHLAQHRADIAARRERRHAPDPIDLDDEADLWDDDAIDEHMTVMAESVKAFAHVNDAEVGVDFGRAAPRYRRGRA